MLFCLDAEGGSNEQHLLQQLGFAQLHPTAQPPLAGCAAAAAGGAGWGHMSAGLGLMLVSPATLWTATVQRQRL
jgi:hypothetical protein